MADSSASKKASIARTDVGEPGALVSYFKKDDDDGDDDDDKVETAKVDYGETTDDASYNDDDDDDDAVSAYEEDEEFAKEKSSRRSSTSITPKKKYDNGANNGTERKSSCAANNKNAQSFDAMYKALLEYKKRNGHLLIPTRYVSMGLGPWVSAQRVNYRRQHENGITLSPTRIEQIERLNKIGFVWDAGFARRLRGSARIQATKNGTSMHTNADDDVAAAVPEPPPKKRTRISNSIEEEAQHGGETIIPGDDDRKELIKSYLRDFDNVLTDEQVLTLTTATTGWSNSEIRSLMNQAAMAPVRDYNRAARLRREQLQETRGTLAGLLSSQNGVNRNEEEPKLRNVEISDFDEALVKVKPSAGSS